MKVLISKGYGAGWATWNTLEMAVDEELIALFEKGCTSEEMEEACTAKGYTSDTGGSVYMGGFEDLAVVEVPKGTRFTIREYDGAEFVEILNRKDWFYADK